MRPTFIVGILASLLPAELRPEWVKNNIPDLRWPAIVGGLAEMFACLVTIILGYKPFVLSQFAAVDPRVVMTGVERSGETAVMGLGLAIGVAYLLRPLTMALVYFSFEGAIRAITALVSNEVIGTLPLYLLLLLSRGSGKGLHEMRLGSRVPDSVVPAPRGEMEYDLEIASCRPKDWNKSLTISYREHLYELAGSFESKSPRRFVYRLKKAAPSKIVRGLHLYDPEEALTS